MVFGALTSGGIIDRALMVDLIAAARPMVVGFHRAFDQLIDQAAGLETLVELGVAVVLTSGGAERALDGAEQLVRLVAQTGGRTDILAGGGGTAGHPRETLARSGVHPVDGQAVTGFRAAPARGPTS